MLAKCAKCEKTEEVNLGRGRPTKVYICATCRVSETNELALDLARKEIRKLREKVSTLEGELQKYKPFASDVTEAKKKRLVMTDVANTFIPPILEWTTWDVIARADKGANLDKSLKDFLASLGIIEEQEE